jgi:hypothetical protein
MMKAGAARLGIYSEGLSLWASPDHGSRQESQVSQHLRFTVKVMNGYRLRSHEVERRLAFAHTASHQRSLHVSQIKHATSSV